MNEQQTGSGRAKRLVSRGLLVLGGTVAATAAAWLISSATASADQLIPDAPGITHQLTGAVGTLSAPVSNTVDGTVGSLNQPAPAPSAPERGLGHVTGSLNTAVHTLHLDGDLPTPAVTAAGLDHVLPVGQLGAGRSTVTPNAPRTGALAAHPAPAAAPAVTGPGRALLAAGPRFVPTPVDRLPASAHELGEHHSAGGLPGAPNSPGEHPFGPLTAPGAPSPTTGAGGSQGPGGPGVSLAQSLPAVPGFDVVHVAAPADEPVATMPGKQPGTTPD